MSSTTMSLQERIVEDFHSTIVESDEKIHRTNSPFLFERRASQRVKLSLHCQGDDVKADL